MRRQWREVEKRRCQAGDSNGNGLVSAGGVAGLEVSQGPDGRGQQPEQTASRSFPASRFAKKGQRTPLIMPLMDAFIKLFSRLCFSLCMLQRPPVLFRSPPLLAWRLLRPRLSRTCTSFTFRLWFSFRWCSATCEAFRRWCPVCLLCLWSILLVPDLPVNLTLGLPACFSYLFWTIAACLPVVDPFFSRLPLCAQFLVNRTASTPRQWDCLALLCSVNLIKRYYSGCLCSLEF